MTPKKILIVSGEPSGDLHASNLVNNLKALHPGLTFFGLGGSLSRKAGVDVIFDIADLAIVGLVEVFRHFGTIQKVHNELLKRADADKPDLAILIDYPGFNLRLAKELKKRSIPVVYYISPQIWAWGAWRISTIKECVKKIIVFFGFEEELYRSHGVDATFVGHPLVDTVKVTLSADELKRRYGLAAGKTMIALLPGSRKLEVEKILPVMVQACKLIDRSLGGAQFVVAKYRDLPLKFYEDTVKGSGLDIKIADGDTYNVTKHADFAIVTSGTATLETAMLGTPLLLVYKASPLTELAYYIVRRIKFLGLVNIIAGHQVIPELLQAAASPERIAKTSLGIIQNPQAKAHMLDELKRVSLSLGSPGASERAARAILPYLR